MPPNLFRRSIAAALEYMRNEHDPPRRSVLDEKRDEHGVYGAESTGEDNDEENDGAGSREYGASRSREHLGEGSGDRSIGGNGLRERLANANESREDLTRSSGDTFDDESDAESQKVHGQPSISDFASKGHKASFSDAGKSSFSDTGATSSGPSSSVNSLLSNHTNTGTSAHTDADDHPSHAVDTGSTDDHLVVHDEEDQHEADASFSSEPCFDQAFSFNPSARPQPRAAQDPDKRVSTASSQRTLTAWNTGGFVFPNNNANAEQQQGGAPLARLHTTDGNLDVEHEVESEPLPKPTPRPARLGQLAGSLKRRSASMSILLPPMMSPRSPGPESEASSPGLMPTSPPPPMPTRHAHFDGAVTDSEGTAPVRKRSRRVPGGIKGKIAAWTAAADPQHRPKKHTNREAEPRRSDSPHHQGYPYSHSPASAPALQVHTHVHIPQLPAAAQTPLMSIAALAPAARDLALGVGKRVEKFYRARSASGAGHEQRPSLGGMRTTSSTGRGAHTHAHVNTHANTIGLGLGVEPVLSAPLRPAVPGASGLVFGRALEDPNVPRDMDGWTDEILGVRRCVGLPVFVSRSVRHLERWGGDEEGLFRISGRPSHVSRLRTEFDAGADYDLYEIPPSDLDPHAVSSLFKAYLRQLPEPILTRALKGQFDMAMTATDSTSNASFDISKLPTSMTSFGESSENMRSLDDALLADIKVLIDQLPQANYNLLHELCHLLRYTTEHAHTTKMPIGNLLLLFCPTLGLSAGFLKCLVEGQDVLFEWGRKPPAESLLPVPLVPRSTKTSVSTVTGPTTSPAPSKHAPSASTSAAPSSIRSIKSPLAISTDMSSPRARAQTTTSSGPPSRASMFFPNLPKRPSISRLFGVGNSNHDLINSAPRESRHSSSSSESYMTSDEDDQQQVAQYGNQKRQTRPPRVSLDIPDGSFAPSLSPTKDAPETEAESGASPSSASAKRLAQTPIADMFKSPLTAAVATTAPSTVTATAVSSKTMPPRLGLQLGNSQDVDEMGWSRGVLDAAASASLGHR
ncbi:GTPase-activator protein for Rho-like GTPases, partial [Rhizoctonia solani]